MTISPANVGVLRHPASDANLLTPLPRAYWKVPWIVLKECCTPAGRQRRPEPMIMDDPDSVAQFHNGADVSPGIRAIHDLSARCLSVLLPEGGRLLDLGCGSGRALVYLGLRRPDIKITGVDLASNMLKRAREFASAARINDRLRLIEADITNLPDAVSSVPWDAISCVWTLHHLPSFRMLQAALRQIASLRCNFGSAIWILDFQRLKNADSFCAGMRALEPALPERLRQDATASEAAAFTFRETEMTLAGAGMPTLTGGCSHPLPWMQAHWESAAGRTPGPSRFWRELTTGRPTRLDAILLRYGFRGLPI